MLRIQDADQELADEEMADEWLVREQKVGDWRTRYSDQIAQTGLEDHSGQGGGGAETEREISAEQHTQRETVEPNLLSKNNLSGLPDEPLNAQLNEPANYRKRYFE